MNNVVYIRTLKKADNTVFCVAKGQKYYYDAQFNRRVPFSSGQQVKRSVIDCLCDTLDQELSPTTFILDITKQGELKESEVWTTCDPSNPDQLFGGWMKAEKGGNDRSLKRRSPLSISAMTALHPLLAGVMNDQVSFDRSNSSNNIIVVRDAKGKSLSDKDISALLEGQNRSLNRKWIPEQSRASGLFVVDMAIDLRRLFAVRLNTFEPEVSEDVIKKLKKDRWVLSKNIYGECLVAPKKVREQWIKALAKALLNWRITSNQSRTFSLMDTLAISISDYPNLISASIRADISDEDSKKVLPVVDEMISGVDTFISLQAKSVLQTRGEKVNALQLAENFLIKKMMSYDYEGNKGLRKK